MTLNVTTDCHSNAPPSFWGDERTISMDFSHPLARGAKVWTAQLADGGTRRILVIVTNAVLDPAKKKFNPEHIARLTTAAQEFLQDSGEADGFLFANRMRDWENSR